MGSIGVHIVGGARSHPPDTKTNSPRQTELILRYMLPLLMFLGVHD